jgi:DNA polymerase-3 subunit epsilon
MLALEYSRRKTLCMRWIAIDFETATSRRDSACALGLVVVEAGSIVAEREWLIRPPGNEYHTGNVAVHGIMPARTESAPDFDDVWDEASALLDGQPFVAHNAGFDMAVLRACCERWNVPVPQIEYVCTLQMSRKAWPGLDSHRLPVVFDRIGGGDINHHDALADARACSHILAAAIDHADAVGVHDAAARLGCSVRTLRAPEPAAADVSLQQP